MSEPSHPTFAPSVRDRIKVGDLVNHRPSYGSSSFALAKQF